MLAGEDVGANIKGRLEEHAKARSYQRKHQQGRS